MKPRVIDSFIPDNVVSDYERISFMRFNKKEKEMEKVLVKLSSKTCAPCKALQINIDLMENKGTLGVDEVQYFEVEDCPEVFKELDVRSVPTLILYADGNEIRRTTGFKTEDQLLDFIG